MLKKSLSNFLRCRTARGASLRGVFARTRWLRFGTVFLIDQRTNLKVDELISLFRKLAPTIDRLPEDQRQQFAVWFEQILRRLAKKDDKDREIKQIVSKADADGHHSRYV